MIFDENFKNTSITWKREKIEVVLYLFDNSKQGQNPFQLQNLKIKLAKILFDIVFEILLQ